MGSHHPPATDQVAVIMVPFPAQGHLNQLLQLSCLFCKHDIPVYYISSAIHIRQAKSRVNGLNPLDVAKIRFSDIPIPPFESPPPDSKIRYPSQLQPAWDAAMSQRLPVASFLRGISATIKRVVVIHDPLMAYVVQDVASITNGESYVYNCISAFSGSSMYLDLEGIPSPDEMPKDIPSFELGCFPQEMLDLVEKQLEPLKLKAGELFNTCREIEAPFLDILANSEIFGDRKVWAIGPILLQVIWQNREKTTCDVPQKCLEWLDKQGPKSVIYVSFGTTTSFSDEEIKELAMGLERSKCKFLWVLRDADKGDIFVDSTSIRQAELPEGFEERVEGVGFVVRDWAPQPEILAHGSVGGFMSHCGWNSCIESLIMGVPIAALPIHSDQPRNSYLVTNILKVGIPARDWYHQKEEIVNASNVEKAVKTLMASEEGRKIRSRAEELADAIRRATEEGGVSRLQLDSFIAHITR